MREADRSRRPGSPAAIAARIHELLPDLPSRVPVDQLCYQLDIVSIEEIATQGFEAALVMDELKASDAILLAADRSLQRRRFSIAHELGHFLLPSHRSTEGHPFECSLTDLHLLDARSRERRKRVEAEANRFAAHLLMPPSRLRATIRQSTASLETLVAMAREFAVSKEAMARPGLRRVVSPSRSFSPMTVRAPPIPERGFPVAARLQRPAPAGEPRAVQYSFAPGTFSAIEEAEPDVWLTERDAARTLLLTEQVLGQREGYSLILLQAKMDED